MIAQAAALIIFVGMFVLIILDKFERQWVTLVSGLLMLDQLVHDRVHRRHDDYGGGPRSFRLLPVAVPVSGQGGSLSSGTAPDLLHVHVGISVDVH